MIFEGKKYVKVNHIQLGDLKVSEVTGILYHHDHHDNYMVGRVETETIETASSYYRLPTPPTFDEWLNKSDPIKLPDISRALREAFEAGQRRGLK